MRAKRTHTGILTKLVLVALLVYAVATLVTLRSKISDVERQNEVLEQSVVDKTAENDDIQYAVEHSDDEEVIRDIATDKLGLEEPGTEVFQPGG